MLVIAQLIALTTVPTEMDPALEQYGACISGRIEARQGEIVRRPSRARDVIGSIQRACATVRGDALAAADEALSSLPSFQDKAARKAFVADRFNERDAYLANMFDGSAFAEKVDQ